MIVQTIYQCDLCNVKFTGSPWLTGVSGDTHFCGEKCRSKWIEVRYADVAATPEPGPAPGNASKGDE